MRSELAAENPAIDQPATPQISPAVLSATARPAIAETATQARSDAPAEATRKGGKPARAAAQPDGVVAGPGAAPDAAPALALNSPAPSAALATAKPALVQDAPSAETVVSDPLAEILANQAPPPPALVQVQSVAQPEPTIAGSKSGAELGFADRALRPGLAGAENALAAATTVSTSGPAGPVTADSPAFAIAPDAQPASAPVAPATAGLPSPMLGQTIAPTATHPASLQHVYPTQSAPPPGTVTAQPGRIGREMGVEIARRVASGQEEMLIRLNPQDMGRIEVRLSFDDSGAVRAVLASESPAALEMLRRDTGDLARSLADAGVRSDAQSFRFDRSGGESGWQRGQSGQGGQSGQSGREQHGGPYQAGAEDDQDLPAYRQLRGSGQLNLLA
jgi:flagellar hook-length control protein FliK